MTGHGIRRIVHCLVGLSLVLSLAGCGFHLRGQLAPLAIDRVQLQSQIRDPELVEFIGRRLEARGLQLVDAAGDAWTLELSKLERDKRVVSTSARITVERYELTLSVHLLIRAPGGETRVADRLSVSRSYDFDSSNLVGGAAEEDLLLGEIRAALADQVLTRLSAASAEAS